MLHPTLRRKSTLRMISALFVLFSVCLPAGARSTAAANPGIAANPSALVATVQLGQSSTTTVTITNMSGSRLAPMLFEAYPEAAPAALGSARLAGGRRAVSLPQQSDRLDSQLLPAFQSAPDRRADF